MLEESEDTLGRGSESNAHRSSLTSIISYQAAFLMMKGWEMHLEQLVPMHKHGRDNVDRCIHRQCPQVGLWQKGKQIGHATSPWVQEFAWQLPTKVLMLRAPKAEQFGRREAIIVVPGQLLLSQGKVSGVLIGTTCLRENLMSRNLALT